MQPHICTLGIDIGSTTAKLVVMAGRQVIARRYVRHLSCIRQTTLHILREFSEELSAGPFAVAVSGSAGLGLAQAAGLPFVQEVYATGEAMRMLQPDAGMVIELGGEDAKVIFYAGGFDQRMNGTCAGGTGAFIDQMAALMNMTVAEMDAASLGARTIYPIASRCGVFAKSDLQPLLNQGAAKADVAASIYQAVVNQTVSGLMQGRRPQGKILFLGGPLHYCQGLRKRFVQTLDLTEETAVFPEYGRFAVAIGAAMYASENGARVSFGELIDRIEKTEGRTANRAGRLEPLFESREDYDAFAARHARAAIAQTDLSGYRGSAWLGIDCGSTTTKLALVAQDGSLLYTYYSSNQGEPLKLVKKQLEKLYDLCGDRVRICGSAVTGYGEELIRRAFHVDKGVVETLAHYAAARRFARNVDFILDIGGQDIKCFHIQNGAIDSIMLNEACSSGCGSFIESFAKAMGFTTREFAEAGLWAKAPVDLGSRCTVFMNSSVKQAQKEGAPVADVAAGLAISVVKNAVYKVIRARSPEQLGRRIVVQGGTFANDAVLRAFEKEMNMQVIRPVQAGLMGAYGAALHAMEKKRSSLLTREQLRAFSHTATPSVCGGCANHCHLTMNRFSDGSRFLSGNQCSKPLGIKKDERVPNLFDWKRKYLASLTPLGFAPRGAIGIPMGLSVYELAPLWHALFSRLGFSVHFSAPSNRRTYERGQFNIPSDTICYPAKLMHGHVDELIQKGMGTLFYPGLTMNVNEHAGDNHYNCPVVAYYGEVLGAAGQSGWRMLTPYLNLDSSAALARTLYPCVHELDATIGKNELLDAARAGFRAYERYKSALRREGESALAWARANARRIMILAGRPYHIDPEVSHGIDHLAASLGFAVVSEDSVCHLAPARKRKVLDQWTFHSRLYRAADYAAAHPDCELVQLVSFGCGIDAITADEVRDILEAAGRFYTQIKIDEISNHGAVKIRLRSLLGAIEEREKAHAE